MIFIPVSWYDITKFCISKHQNTRVIKYLCATVATPTSLSTWPIKIVFLVELEKTSTSLTEDTTFDECYCGCMSQLTLWLSIFSYNSNINKID